MKKLFHCLLMAGVIVTGVPGVLLMRCAWWCGDRMREVQP